MLLYAISRFIIEFYRGDPRGMLWGLSTSQFVSMVLVPLSVFMLWRLQPPCGAGDAAAGGARLESFAGRHRSLQRRRSRRRSSRTRRMRTRVSIS